MNYLIKELAYNDAEKYSDWGSLDSMAKAFEDIPVLLNEKRNEKYIDLPAKVMSLPANRGIRLVCPMQDQSYSFIYRANNTVNIYKQLDVDNYSDIPRYYVEGQRLYFDKHIPDYFDVLLLKLIVEFDDLEDNDEVEIPSRYGKLIFDLVMKSMLGMPFEKVSNDNNANIP